MVLFSSGMAAASAVLGGLREGDALVLPSDGYYTIRALARDRLEPAGVDVRLVPTDTDAVAAAAPGAALVWIETPSNPGLDACDVRAVADAARAAGALLAVDNTLATPLHQRPLELGADLSVVSATKSLSGHSDLLLGYAAVRDPERAQALRAWRVQAGAIAGPFEAWLAHRSLATLDVRLERQCQNAAALAEMLARRDDVAAVRYPGLPDDPAHEVAARQMDRFGALIGFDPGGARRAQTLLAACELVSESTSFGGVHTTAERRARWGGDAVPEGLIRLSVGCEAAEDLLADVAHALDVSAADI